MAYRIRLLTVCFIWCVGCGENSSRNPVGDGGDVEGESGRDPSDTGVPSGLSLVDRIQVSSAELAEGVKSGERNWRVWASESFRVAPVFIAPLENCGTLVGYTGETGGGITARAAVFDESDTLVRELVLGENLELRGLAAEPDGHFGALLWDDTADAIRVERFAFDGTSVGSTPLVNSDNSPTDFGIGDSRLTFGGGTYGAYYHVHSDSGHEGDTLKWVNAASGAESTEWSWGCSHSMSNLLSFHGDLGEFLPVCVTDCYPGTDGDFATQSQGGLYFNHRNHIMDVDGGCNGSVAAELGGAAVAPNGWKVVFNAHQAPMTLGQDSYDPGSMNQDIGFVSIGADGSVSDVVWLTHSSDQDEADAAMARWTPDGDSDEQYVVGWQGDGAHHLARVGSDGAILEGPSDVSGTVSWGERDDPFRRHTNGDIVWAWFDDAGSQTLHLARILSGGTATCATF